uniref:Elongin-A n=1 Tax=Spongospora subterranea TaxID=70186 RepID=A0A0H5QME1_9EUKA|eukprot:CRZ02747.1 hypothetical protein [Spongospora subterranea]
MLLSLKAFLTICWISLTVFHKPRQRRSVPDGAVVPVVPVKGHVPPLQTLCLNQIRVQIGRVAALNEVFPTSLLLAMVENAKAQDLARIERHNPDVANDLSPCWEKVVRLDLPEQYRSIQNPNSLPPDFWRKFYENTLSDRQKKTEEYADTLSSRKQKLEQDKIGSSIKKLSFSAGIVKKAMKRSRDLSCSSATPVLKDRRPKPGNGKLAKLLAPAKARLKMETKLHK